MALEKRLRLCAWQASHGGHVKIFPAHEIAVGGPEYEGCQKWRN